MPSPRLRQVDLPLEVHIFIDNSNIWIEAKKLLGDIMGSDEQEPRRSIDIGSMVKLLVGGRAV